MSYNLKLDIEDRILRVEIEGDRTKGDLVSNARAAWPEIATACSNNNLARILVVSHASGKYSTFDAFQINSTLAECGVQKSWRIAFVNLDQKSYEEIEFDETIAVNRGFAVKIFKNEEDARAWLE